jgi:hypothetical protein
VGVELDFQHRQSILARASCIPERMSRSGAGWLM